MHRHVHGRPQQVKIYMFLFPCSYETTCINCNVYVRDRNSAQIPDVSLRFVNQYIFRKLSQMYHVFVLERTNKKNPFQRGETIRKVTEHWAPCADRLVSHTICNFPLFHLQAASITWNRFILQLKNVHCNIWRELLLLRLTGSVTAQDSVVFLIQLMTETSWESLC